MCAVCRPALPGRRDRRGRLGLSPCGCVSIVPCPTTPALCREGGVEVEPDTFVAAKRLRDGREGGGAQALTRVVSGTRRPVWNQALELRYSEAELAAGEQLLLALVNNSNSRLMIKARLSARARAGAGAGTEAGVGAVGRRLGRGRWGGGWGGGGGAVRRQAGQRTRVWHGGG